MLNVYTVLGRSLVNAWLEVEDRNFWGNGGVTFSNAPLYAIGLF